MRGAWRIVLAACGRLGFELELTIDTPAARRCDDSFTQVANAPLRYGFKPSPVKWIEAVTTCREFGPGHSLALPTSDDERLALSAEARATVVERWWSGGTDRATEGTWLDPDGAPITYQPWALGEPNDTGGQEDCLDLLADPVEGTARTDRFDDRSCDATLPFICACSL